MLLYVFAYWLRDKVANSPVYGFRGDVSTVDRAATLLGNRAIRLIALSVSFLQTFDEKLQASAAFDPREFWKHSLGCAAVAEELGGQGGGHPGAGGATIPKGSEERFINTVEKLLSARLDNNIKEEAHNLEKTEPTGTLSTSPSSQKERGAQAVASGQTRSQEEGKAYGRINEGTPAQGEGEGREEEGQGREEGRAAKKRSSPDSKEMERQGLVRYLFS